MTLTPPAAAAPLDLADLPTAEQTQAALETLPQRDPDARTTSDPNARAALVELAKRVMETVIDLDRSANISSHIRSLRVVCKGPSHFELELDDIQCSDAETRQAIQDAMQPEGGGYGKPLRRIAVDVDGPRRAPPQVTIAAPTAEEASMPCDQAGSEQVPVQQ